MNPRFQSAFALVLIACIVVIVYSPFVDLPLTDTKTGHSPVQPVCAVLISVAPNLGSAQSSLAPLLQHATVISTDVVAITCAYLC